MVGIPAVAQLFQPLHDHGRELLQPVLVGRTEILARTMIDQAQRAQRMPLLRKQRRTRIEADVRRTRHQRIVAKARIPTGIEHHQAIAGQDGVGTEGHRARRLMRRQAGTRLEPLPLFIHQRYQRNLHAKERAGQFGDLVTGFIRQRVEHAIALQRRQPGAFIVRQARLHCVIRVLGRFKKHESAHHPCGRCQLEGRDQACQRTCLRGERLGRSGGLFHQR